MRVPIATEASSSHLSDRVNALRESEPDPFTSTPEQIEAYLGTVGELIALAGSDNPEVLSEPQTRYLHEASMRQVRFARARLDHDRQIALEILRRLFTLGAPPQPHGHYQGELLAISTGLLSDPFFEWLTRIYLPWQGKTFDAHAASGDNLFADNTWSKATEKLGWPEYRVPSEDPPGMVRVFPFRTSIAPGIEEPETRVVKLDYAAAPNPLPVRRITDEIVELPGGYILGKAHMRGLREFRRVALFGLIRRGG